MATTGTMSVLHKSTNVRSFTVSRFLFPILGRIAPGIAAAAAERLFRTPPPPRRSTGEAMLQTAQMFHVLDGAERVSAWRWGSGPAVVLLHGWGGRAAQLTSFVQPFLRRGFSVVAFDAPGHGLSVRGMSSAPQFARALRSVAEHVGGVYGVVAHSLGAAATALAIRDGLEVARVAFISPAADPPSWVVPFAARFGMPPSVIGRMRERVEQRLEVRWQELNVPSLVASNTAPLLVVHDRDDEEVPLSDGVAISSAWPRARLVETTGLGHNRLLRDRAVIDHVIDFLADGCSRDLVCEPSVDNAETWNVASLDQELFDRHLRWRVYERPAA